MRTILFGNPFPAVQTLIRTDEKSNDRISRDRSPETSGDRSPQEDHTESTRRRSHFCCETIDRSLSSDPTRQLRSPFFRAHGRLRNIGRNPTEGRYGRAVREFPWVERAGPWNAIVIGCGLIGGSLAFALRDSWGAKVIGVDRGPVLSAALARSAIDASYPTHAIDQALADERPALVLIATGMETILELLPALAKHLRSIRAEIRPLVMDVGSVKVPVVELANELQLPHFVGGHPMAGRERGGIEHATPALFRDCRFVLCPARTTSPSDVEAARELVRGWKSEPILVDPYVHDRCVAMVSHLPHLAAWSLMHAADRMAPSLEPEGLLWALAAGSWRDATRVAASDPALWNGILNANRTAVLEALDVWLATLQHLREGLAKNDTRSLLDGIDAEHLADLRRRLDDPRPS